MLNPKYYLNKPLFVLYIINNIFNLLIFISILLFIICKNIFFYNLIVDIQQSDNFKLFYIHVPVAWLAVIIYLFMLFNSIIYIINSLKLSQLIISSSINLGLLMIFLTLFSGSLWGLLTWGTLWVWDARLTSSFILFIIYLIFYIYKKIFIKDHNNFFILSLLCILASINIPILKYSVNWWNTLHQVQSLDSFNSMFDNSIFLFLIFFLSFLLCYVLIYYMLEIRCYILLNKLIIIKNF